jgi:hypothetical protein
LRVERTLGQWRPYLKAEFPLDASLAKRDVFANLLVEASRLHDQSYTVESFLKELVKRHSRLAASNVR